MLMFAFNVAGFTFAELLGIVPIFSCLVVRSVNVFVSCIVDAIYKVTPCVIVRTADKLSKVPPPIVPKKALKTVADSASEHVADIPAIVKYFARVPYGEIFPSLSTSTFIFMLLIVNGAKFAMMFHR